MSVTGSLLRVATFGESHGAGVGCILDGIPSGLYVDKEVVQSALRRRRPGQSILTTARTEPDEVEILSGLTDEGVTLGTPIAMLVRNQDQRKLDYANTSATPRPGHADYTYMQKYGITAGSGGGRASARETVGRVAAGAIAERWMREEYGTRIVSWVSVVGSIRIPDDVAKGLEASPPQREEVEALGSVQELPTGAFEPTTNRNVRGVSTRCPHPSTAAEVAELIKKMRNANDSVGGVITCAIRGCPVGIGEPCFDKVEAELAKAMMSLPATKGFEIGDGFKGVELPGSKHNDMFVMPTANHTTTVGTSKGSSDSGKADKANVEDMHTRKKRLVETAPLLSVRTNHAGGSLGGITTGQDILFRVAIKAASSISQPQQTCSYTGLESQLVIEGRHDPCVLPRAPPIIEAMAALVIADLTLRQRARTAFPLRALPVEWLVTNRESAVCSQEDSEGGKDDRKEEAEADGVLPVDTAKRL